jgi:aspartate aminotransferase
MQNSPLSKLAQTLIGSEIVKISGTIKEKIKQGEHIYNYTIGDFDSTQFPIPEALCEEIKTAYQNGFTNYPIADGEADTRAAVLEFIKENELLDYSNTEILIAAGGRPLIYAVFRALVDAGDKVIYPIPSWNNNHYAHFTAAHHVVIHSEQANNFMPTAAQIKPHLKGATLLALCSPLNPTGTVFTKEGLAEICDLIVAENATRAADEKKLYLMYDQIYWTLTFGDTKHYNPVSLNPAMKPYTIFIDGISKAFAATGVRVGWALGPEHVITKMKAINSHVGAWAPMAEQKAVAKFLNQKENVANYFKTFKKELEFRLDAIYNGFNSLKQQGYPVDVIAPQAAIYLTVQINLVGKQVNGKIIESQNEVTAFILNEAKLALVPFFAFGTNEESNWYRISVGCVKKEEIAEMFQKLKSALDKLA